MKTKQQIINEALEILMEGRTFYDGYFDQPNLSRTDEAIKVLLQNTKDDSVQDITCEVHKALVRKVEHVLTYICGYDKTVIWENIYHLVNDKFELVSERVIGWYYGEPDAKDYKKYCYRLAAAYKVR